VWLDSVSMYGSGYQGTNMLPVSNELVDIPGGHRIVTVVDLGTSGVRFTQTFTLMDGDRFITKDWQFVNRGATTYGTVRLYHGGDSFFGGSDSARGYFDATKSMVYVRNNDYTNWGIMGFYANPGSPASRYVEGQYNVGNGYASSGGNLPNTVDPSYVDAGYYLQWDRAGFSPDATWTVQAYEQWTPGGALQLLAPGPQNVSADTTVTLPFTLQNLATSSRDVTLTVASSQTSWTPEIMGGSTRTIAGGDIETVYVKVAVPVGADGSADVTVTARGSGGELVDGVTSLTEVFLDVIIDPTDLSLRAPAGVEGTGSVSVTNHGDPITFGTLAADSPFGIGTDHVSGKVLGTGETTTVPVTLLTMTPGTYTGLLNIPIASPVLLTRTVNLTGEVPYTITSSAGGGGSISPLGSTTVTGGADATFTVTPDSGYRVASLLVDGVPAVLTDGKYVFHGVTANHTIAVTFERYWTITSSAGAGGSISPLGATEVTAGATATFTVTPAAGHHVATLTVDGSAEATTATSYTFANVTAAHTIGVSFVAETFTVTPAHGADVAIDPDAPTSVDYGGALTCTFTPGVGFHVASLLVDSDFFEYGANTYSFTNVTADHAITVYVALNQYTLGFQTDGTPGASVSRASQTVLHGYPSEPVTATAPTGRHFVNWTGTSGFTTTTANPLIVPNVTADATMTAHFAIDTFEIVPTAGPHGAISPGTTQTIDYGGSLTCTFTPAAGFSVATLTVDGSAAATTATSYTFADVKASHTIDVSFTKGLTIAGATADGKVYDGGTTATVDFSGATLVGVAPGDDVTITTTGNRADFATRTVGDRIPVTVAGVTLGGADAGGYTLTQPTGLVAEITAKQVTGHFTSADKTYDGSTDASATNRSVTGTITGETVTLVSGTAAFDTKDVGTGKTVTLTGASLGGADASNYSLASPTVTTATIIAKGLTVTGAVAHDKVYDGTAAATVDFALAGLVGIVGSDDVTLTTTGYTATFAGPTVGTGKTVTVTGLTLSGTAAGDYSLTQPSLTASITAAAEDIEGGDRYETAVAASRSAFATDSVTTVVLATGADFPDALSAVPLAGAYRGPVLLTPKNVLPTEVTDEIRRLGASSAVVVGGSGVVGAPVYNELVLELGAPNVSRIAGANRYGTAALVAERIESVDPTLDGTVFIATGLKFPDALAGGPDGWAEVRPILLVKGAIVPPETLAALGSLTATRAVVLGGTGAVPLSAATTVQRALTGPKVLVRLAGGTRYGTAEAVADWSANGEGLTWECAGISTGLNFADALGGGPAMGAAGGVMMLTDPTTLSPETETALTDNKTDICTAKFFGGIGAISQGVRDAVMSALQ
jgi:hypothetical protein